MQTPGRTAWVCLGSGGLRARVIQKFLSRERIYQTPGFAPLEQPARENLQRELGRLLQRASEG